MKHQRLTFFHTLQHYLPIFIVEFMKSLISIIAFLMLSFTAFCQGGVNFEHITFDEALAKAKAENKLIFMDCYTSWCGPCKYMTETIFPQEKAGEFFNPKFVCVKFDMEKGEGPELAKRFGVRAYPTFLILRPDGTVQHKVVGGGELDRFITKIEKGLNEKTSLDYLNKVYEKGKMNKKQLMTYNVVLNEAYEKDKSEKVGKELDAVLKEKDKMKKEYWPILERSSYGSDNFNLVLNNIGTFNKNIGKEKVDKYLTGCYTNAINNTLRPNTKEPLKVLQQIQEELTKLDLADQAILTRSLELNQACLEKNVNKVIELAGQIESNKNGELWSIFNVINSVRGDLSKEDLNKIIVLEDKFLGFADERGKAYIKNYFENLKIAAHVGVYFQDLSFEDALAKAKEQGRKLFIDCYTTWCGPCKYMSETVFKKEKIGDFLNQNFICLKYDMEKGEGPELAKKFGVRAYPTFIIMNPDGTIRHKLVGGGEEDQFIERVKESFDDNKALGVLDAKYNNGDRDKAFLAQYAKILVANYDPNAKNVVDELLKISTDEEKISEDYWFIFGNIELSPKDSEADKFLTNNRSKFSATIGKEKVDNRLSEGLSREILMVIAGRGQKTDVKRLDAIGREVKALKLSNEKTLLSFLAIAKAVKTENIDKILSACEKEFSKLGKDSQMIAYYLSGSLAKANDTQKARWQKIIQANMGK